MARLVALFLRRRSVVLPTLLGWLCLLLALTVIATGWWWCGEAFLSETDRKPAEVLVVEGWIGPEGVAAAAAEFHRGGYRYVVTSGGLSGESWSPKRWSYAQVAQHQLLEAHVPAGQVLIAIPRVVETHRTYEAALAVRRTLEAAHIECRAVNVFTEGVHARRSQLVYAKIMRSTSTEVGVISWCPAGFDQTCWWESTDRTQDFLKESFGFAFEFLFNSGRFGVASTPATVPR